MRLWVRSLPLLSGLMNQRCHECGVGRRQGLDPTLLWLWCRLAAVAPIGSLAWEPPCATGVALKSQKNKIKRLPDWRLNGAVAASLHHSHSNVGSKTIPEPAPQPTLFFFTFSISALRLSISLLRLCIFSCFKNIHNCLLKH